MKRYFCGFFEKMPTRVWHRYLVILCVFWCNFAFAQNSPNAIESITANYQGTKTVVTIQTTQPLTQEPRHFSILSASQIILDFPNTIKNNTGFSSQEISPGDVLHVNIVESDQRTRLIFKLKHPLNYTTTLQDKKLILDIDSVHDTTPVALAETSLKAVPAATSSLEATSQKIIPQPPLTKEAHALRTIDFRRGVSGEGRVIIGLSHKNMPVNIREAEGGIRVEFPKTQLPKALQRTLDVLDFGTPVTSITTKAQNNNVHMQITAQGQWEHTTYQSNGQLIIEIKKIKEDPSKLKQGNKGYHGDKLSLDFQNIEVRAILQVIADFTGLNIITSNSVEGSLTLRLTDVPWDQALDIILQTKGLDMRKNGNVIWIAPREELLMKEKNDLEQRALIANLEPIRTESFSLNYHKAEEFKAIFGIGDNAGEKNSILSKRGSVATDPRTNQLFITDVPSVLESVRALIRKVDIPARQVLIEARMVEAEDSFSRNLGSKLSFGVVNDAGSGIGGSGVNLPAGNINGFDPGNLAFTLFNASASKFINLELSALEADGVGKIISSPRVVTADSQKAVIEQGSEIPYTVATSSGATSVEFKKASLKLEVTPQITPDGNVILAVDVTNDSPGETGPGGIAINTKHVQTQVQVENGGTVVIGGIYTQTVRKDVAQIPWLGDIPYLGNLFKNTSERKKKTELLIFLTPKIIKDDRINQ